MIDRRAFLGASLGALLAGCQSTTTAPQASAPARAATPDTRPAPDLSKALMPEDTQDFRIAQVRVTLADDFKRNGKQNGVSNQRIEDIFRQRLTASLANANSKGRIPVRAEVVINSVNFADPSLAILLGSSSSVASSRTTLYYLDTGQQVGRGVDAVGATPGRATIFAAAMIKPPEEELGIVAQNLGPSIRRRLFGRRG